MYYLKSTKFDKKSLFIFHAHLKNSRRFLENLTYFKKSLRNFSTIYVLKIKKCLLLEAFKNILMKKACTRQGTNFLIKKACIKKSPPARMGGGYQMYGGPSRHYWNSMISGNFIVWFDFYYAFFRFFHSFFLFFSLFYFIYFYFILFYFLYYFIFIFFIFLFYYFIILLFYYFIIFIYFYLFIFIFSFFSFLFFSFLFFSFFSFSFYYLSDDPWGHFNTDIEEYLFTTVNETVKTPGGFQEFLFRIQLNSPGSLSG